MINPHCFRAENISSCRIIPALKPCCKNLRRYIRQASHCHFIFPTQFSFPESLASLTEGLLLRWRKYQQYCWIGTYLKYRLNFDTMLHHINFGTMLHHIKLLSGTKEFYRLPCPKSQQSWEDLPPALSGSLGHLPNFF